MSSRRSRSSVTGAETIGYVSHAILLMILNIKQRRVRVLALTSVSKLCLTSDEGWTIESPQFFKQSLNTLRSLHKAFSRKVKGSGNWYRAARALARQYRKVARQRLDYQWKLTTQLCTYFDILVFETLNIDGMKRLWGRKVSDYAFYQFIQLLTQKCAKHEKTLVQIGQWTATTKPCNQCGYENKDLTLSDRRWTCPKCGSPHDRDINAAINIKQAGLAAPKWSTGKTGYASGVNAWCEEAQAPTFT